MNITQQLLPQGDCLLVGNSKGDVLKVDFPPVTVLERLKRPITDLDFTTMFPSKHHNATIDCLAVVGSEVISKSKNGNVFNWSLESGEILSRFRVRNSSYNSSRFGISPNSKYMCVGNETGLVYIYSLTDGKMLAELRHRRSSRPITSCVFAANGRNVVCANDSGFLLRFDYITPATLEEWAAWSFE
ncbi:hypothetical protein DSO57_1037430 [Entomophthora muscae]|uniref:Uncharacterized protein n=1 Tax=Entomophthora muscae TaxID=34485 RepID=A0ACC2UJJ5_9FUNG|nr:hypothetical protein DSO57_1037430 [Entomophthora muscae]